MPPLRFWLLFLALTTVAILFAGRLPAASAAGKTHTRKTHTRKTHSGKPINTPIVKNKPTIKLGMAYIAELRRR